MYRAQLTDQRKEMEGVQRDLRAARAEVVALRAATAARAVSGLAATVPSAPGASPSVDLDLAPPSLAAFSLATPSVGVPSVDLGMHATSTSLRAEALAALDRSMVALPAWPPSSGAAGRGTGMDADTAASAAAAVRATSDLARATHTAATVRALSGAALRATGGGAGLDNGDIDSGLRAVATMNATSPRSPGRAVSPALHGLRSPGAHSSVALTSGYSGLGSNAPSPSADAIRQRLAAVRAATGGVGGTRSAAASPAPGSTYSVADAPATAPRLSVRPSAAAMLSPTAQKYLSQYREQLGGGVGGGSLYSAGGGAGQSRVGRRLELSLGGA